MIRKEYLGSDQVQMVLLKSISVAVSRIYLKAQVEGASRPAADNYVPVKTGCRQDVGRAPKTATRLPYRLQRTKT